VDQAIATGAIAKQHQFLAEHMNQLRHISDLTRQCDRLPVAPQVFSTGSAGVGANQQFIAGAALWCAVTAVTSGSVDGDIFHHVSPSVIKLRSVSEIALSAIAKVIYYGR
jgi:hypothetical protein